MTILLLLYLFLFQENGFSMVGENTAESKKIKKIIHATTLMDLRNYLNLFQEIETSQELCRQRLAHKEFPIACYRNLKLEAQAGLVTEKEQLQRIKIYDEACRKAEVLGQIPNENDLSQVSKKCGSHISSAICKKSYREGLVGDCEFNR